MLLLAFAAPVLGTNCYIMAQEGATECVIVDPGIGVDDKVDELLHEHGLTPVGALVTHGHLDHTFGLAQLCRRWELPVYLHEADAPRLHDPLGTLGPQLAQAFAGFADDWSVPPDIRTLSGNDVLDLAGVRIDALHAPGHTEGSTLYRVPSPDASSADLCFTGDVLFSGTIGRTDLPGGDHAAMLRSLATVVLGIDDATTVLPGHGESSTIGRERVTNPFLTAL